MLALAMPLGCHRVAEQHAPLLNAPAPVDPAPLARPEEKAIVSDGVSGDGYFNARVPPSGAFRSTDRHVANEIDEYENYWADDDSYLLWAMSRPEHDAFRGRFGHALAAYLLTLAAPDGSSFYKRRIGPDYRLDTSWDFLPSLPLYALVRYAKASGDSEVEATAHKLFETQAAAARSLYKGHIHNPESAVASLGFLASAASWLGQREAARDLVRQIASLQDPSGRFPLSETVRHLQVITMVAEVLEREGDIALASADTVGRSMSRAREAVPITTIGRYEVVGFTGPDRNSTLSMITQAFAYLAFRGYDQRKADLAYAQISEAIVHVRFDASTGQFGPRTYEDRLWLTGLPPAREDFYVEHGALEVQALGWIALALHAAK
jgi:hypothetical protein